jgi:homoserine kinase type II
LAVYTSLSLADASRVTEAHGLGQATRITPIPAGSVNTNYFVEGTFGKLFLRIYEEQDESGVAYEWALLDHLAGHGVPLPRRTPGTTPGEIRVAGKPTALFEVVGGEELCHRLIGTAHLAAVGETLAGIHRAGEDFAWKKPGRFERKNVLERLDAADRAARPELLAPVEKLRATLSELERSPARELPRGVIHGDLFRDNVRFEGSRIAAVLDWESASDGIWLYDLVVVFLAWCYGDDFELELARALFASYERVRPLEPVEWDALYDVAREAAVRFSATRITDFHLRGGEGRVMRDYRRFVARLEAIEAMGPEGLRRALA